MREITKENIQSVDLLKKIPKSDLHNHGSYGGNISYISKYFNIYPEPKPIFFDDLEDMTVWFNNNIGKRCAGVKGYIKRIQSAFVQAKVDSIELLAMSFGKKEIEIFGGIQSFVRIINRLQKHYAPNSIFLPELSLRREEDIRGIIPWLEEVLDANWFVSIDISGKEEARSICDFVSIYRIAEKKHLRLKAHVGEFGEAEDIKVAVDTLHLSEVHHGIAAIKSKDVMRWLAREKIQLNICVTSNIRLKRVKDYTSHPIRVFFDYGIPVTINTDDMLIFNSSVSQEYNKLYSCGVFNIEELEMIRKNGLKEKLSQVNNVHKG